MKALDSFTVERLEKWIEAGEAAKDHHDGVRVAGEYLVALARIALAAKRAEPWGYEVSGKLFNSLFVAGNYASEMRCDTLALYTTPQLNYPEIPEDWKLVPIEATLAMLTLLGMTGSFESMQKKYKNMLSAAPKSESE
ncbi:TPA: hypothetical protein PXM28_001499 [Yersinia enterocolitica]|nr:hypothetical protein [Yersinia enterocolitica]